MELHQLEYFVAVAEEASFTRAASRVHVAQPGVSAQVRRLESELGQQLLDRSGRSVRLTEVGSAVLPFARAALDAVANARLAVDDLAGLVRGQVTAGMVSGCALPVLAELLAGFHDRHPGVAIALVEDNSDRLVERLRDGRLDLALIGWAEQTRRTSTAWFSWTRNWSRRWPPIIRSPAPEPGPARSRSASYATCRWSACPAAPACGRRSTPPAPPPGSRRGSCSRPAPCPWWSSWPAGAWDWP
jgi:DNA-binding transcriptional LysR family regulator